MDVHSKNYTLCEMEPVIGGEDRVFANIQVTADYKNVLMFIEDLKLKLGLDNEYDVVCGYEAGCLGYSLYNQLTAAGVKCVILAPTTMLTQQGKREKTDARDALIIPRSINLMSIIRPDLLPNVLYIIYPCKNNRLKGRGFISVNITCSKL